MLDDLVVAAISGAIGGLIGSIAVSAPTYIRYRCWLRKFRAENRRERDRWYEEIGLPLPD